jgi:cellobiose phosphorylase
MDRPITYHGGPERLFRRAESASFFGREIGLMYVHAHLRYAEAMSVLGESAALWDALLVANPIAVTDRLHHASLRQRNAYFSSSDAAFQDRYQASAEWSRLRDEI